MEQKLTPFQAVAQKPAPTTLAGMLQSPAYSERFKQVLGERASQYVASLIQVGRNLGDVEPISIIAAGMTAAALDLTVDKNLGFAWIVPYKEGGKSYAQFQIGHRGFIQLAMRSGQYARMNASAINEEAYGGRDDVGEPIILWDKVDDTKPAIGYAFAFRLINGFTKVTYWSKAKVEAHAMRYSQAYKKGYTTPWKTHFDQMALKTVIKNELHNWGVLSIQMQKGLAHDQGMQRDVDVEVTYPDNGQSLLQAPDFGDTNLTPTTAEDPTKKVTPSDSHPSTGASETQNAHDRFTTWMQNNDVTFVSLIRWAVKTKQFPDADSVSSLTGIDPRVIRKWESRMDLKQAIVEGQ